MAAIGQSRGRSHMYRGIHGPSPSTSADHYRHLQACSERRRGIPGLRKYSSSLNVRRYHARSSGRPHGYSHKCNCAIGHRSWTMSTVHVNMCSQRHTGSHRCRFACTDHRTNYYGTGNDAVRCLRPRLSPAQPAARVGYSLWASAAVIHTGKRGTITYAGTGYAYCSATGLIRSRLWQLPFKLYSEQYKRVRYSPWHRRSSLVGNW
jgi:hypothetical protein